MFHFSIKNIFLHNSMFRCRVILKVKIEPLFGPNWPNYPITKSHSFFKLLTIGVSDSNSILQFWFVTGNVPETDGAEIIISQDVHHQVGNLESSISGHNES